MRRFFRRHRAAISLTVAVSLFAASVLFRAIPGRQSPMTGTKSLKALTAKMEQNGSSAESADRQPATTAKKRAQRKQKPEFFSLHQSAPCCEAGQLLQDADMAAVARYVATVWDGRKPDLEDPPVRFGTPAQAVYVAVRGKGARLAEAWETHGSTAEALVAAVGRAKAAVPAGKAKTVDTLEINLSHNYRQYRLGDRAGRQLFDNVYRGVRGLEIEYNGIVERYGPTYVIASNRGNENLLDRFRRHHRIDRRAMEKDSRVFSFEGEQLLVKLGTEPGAMLMQRGNMLVDPAEVNAANTGKLADLAAAWLRHNVHGDGRITYKYWPSAKREAQSNNMIRQWMATVALGMLAQKTGKPEDWGLMKRNINYNLNRFYSSEDGHGLIEYQNQVKLGAVALAAMAILEHPERSRWADQEQALHLTIDALWHEDGSFSTYFKPKGLQRNQNFYPGEALLYWALLYERDRNPELLRRFLMSYEYYRAWH
ncbi:MAG: hypothetical protein IBX56_15740, partial [Methylomicrobium sp.]|nr:hypothetical protein [Methylomicrobium sp.]